jgi:uncharacterized surface protein with fasciclin (FAS1) repeats
MQYALSVVLLLAANVHAQSDIVDTAVAANFTILAEALTKADLVTTLKGSGPFTVFAPTDAAFTAALGALGITKAELLNKPDLAAILTYHVVSGSVKSTDLTNGMTAATVQGSSLTISINGSTVKVNTATVTSADIMCSNGVIHIIDEVLLPPAADPTPAPEPEPEPAPSPSPGGELKDIVDTAVAAGTFTVLAEALTKADLIATAKSAGPFTVFAPTDAAFAAALETLGITKEQLLAKDDLGAILTYHIVSGTVKSTDLSNGMEAATVNGAKVTITIDGSTVKVNTATVTAADIMCSNGVIHVIDAVLLPPAAPPSEPESQPSTTQASETDTAYTGQKFATLMFGSLLSAFVCM